MMKPPYLLEETRETKAKFKAVLGDHIPKNELRRLRASLEAMDLTPNYDSDDHADGMVGDTINQEPTQRPQQDS